VLYLADGATETRAGISLESDAQSNDDHLADRIPETTPYDLALRCDPDGNMPQVQFNEDGVWHDFAPRDEYKRNALPLYSSEWFPYLELDKGDRVSDFRVEEHNHSLARAAKYNQDHSLARQQARQKEEARQQTESYVAKHGKTADGPRAF
jgi:hypothetical protein